MKNFDFRLKEYDTAVIERAEIIREINRIEKGCLIATGFIFSWLLSQTNNSSDKLFLISWGIPIIISGLGCWRVLALNHILENRESYLRKLENKFCHDEPEGLFSFYHTNSKKDSKGRNKHSGDQKKTYIGRSSIVYWTVLLLLCLFVPLLKFLSI